MRFLIFLTLLLFVGCSEQPGPTGSGLETAVSNTPTPSPTQTSVIPDERARRLALGTNPETLLTDVVEQSAVLSEPGPRDWLAEHKELGQTYGRYIVGKPNRPDETRNTIYIWPLEDFSSTPYSMESLRDYTAAFFAMPVKVMGNSPELKGKSRIDIFTKKKQLLTTDLLDLLESELPSDAYCLLGVTLTDLYPQEDWNYVFGQARLKRRVGVYSLARYDPQFFGQRRSEEWQKKALQRSCKVLAHETCHMLGMWHCIYYNCLMNGSNNLAEMDGQKPFLCAICLRKLAYALDLDLRTRYQNLREFFVSRGLTEQVSWLNDILSSKRATPKMVIPIEH